MGSFFTNVHIRSDDMAAVHTYIERELRDSTTLIAPPVEGWISVYPEATESQDPARLEAIVGGLARATRSPCIAFLVHDDDFLAYWLEHDGRVDLYNSCPDYFEPTPAPTAERGGSSELLASIGTAGRSATEIERVLRSESGSFESDRAELLAAMLGIPTEHATVGFNYIRAGEIPEDMPALTELPKSGGNTADERRSRFRIVR